MDFPHGVMLQVRSTTTTRDKLGDGTTDTTTHDWGPCALAPRSSVEGDDNAPGVIVGLTILGPPPPVQLDSDDTIVIPDGNTYAGTWSVDGIPGDYQHPMTGWHPGVEVAVKRAGVV